MSGDKMGTALSDQRVEGFVAEGGNLALKKIVKPGTNENQVAAASAAADNVRGVVNEAGYQYGPVGVITRGPATVDAGGVAAVGDMAILSSTGQKVLSVEQDPDTSSDEILVLGRFLSASSADGDEVVIDLDPQKVKNTKKEVIETIAVGAFQEIGEVKVEQTIGTLSATYTADVFQADKDVTITSFKLAVRTSVTANDTNYWEVNLINEGDDGSGTDDLLDNTSDVNTTKATGGSGLTADVLRDFALDSGNVAITAGDVLRLVLTKTASGADLVGVFIEIGYYDASGEFAIFEAPLDLLITRIEIANSVDISASDTNYYTFNATNKGTDGTGTDEILLTTSSANTTKSTGGAALEDFVYRSLGLHATTANRQINSGEVVAFKITKTGEPTDLAGVSLRIGYTKR